MISGVLQTATSRTDALALAGAIGYAHFDEIGEKAFEELELAYASTIAPRFREKPDIRPWQNVNFYWAKCYFKNTIQEVFAKCLPDTYRKRKITSASTEIMFGSMREDHKDIIPPMFYGNSLAFIPEVLSFLGQGETLRIKTDILNEVVEGKEITRDLVKFGEASEELREKYNDPSGLYLTPTSLQYTPKTCFAIATRPLERKIFTYLDGSGFLSRFHTIQICIPDQMVSRINTGSSWQKDLSEDSEIAAKMTELKTFNTELMTYWSLHSEPIHLPDYNNVWLPISQTADTIARTYAEKLDLDLKNIWNIRVADEILREINAFKMLYPHCTEEQLLSWCNAKRLQHFFEFAVSPDIAKEVFTEAPKLASLCFDLIQSTFKGRKAVTRGEIVANLEAQGFKRPTIDRAKDRCKRSSEYGKYDFD